MNGGYKMVSLKNVNFDVNGSTKVRDSHIIKGVFDLVENNHRKNVLLGDLIIGGVERTERFVSFGYTDNFYTGYITISDAVNYIIEITDEDEVIIKSE